MSDAPSLDPATQVRDLAAKAAAAVDRLGDYTRVRHWEAARAGGLTPLQHKLLLNLRYRGHVDAKPSALASYYGVARPTISEATRILLKKGLLGKRRSPDDGRASELFLTPAGEASLTTLPDPLAELRASLGQLPADGLAEVFASLYALIDGLERGGQLHRQRNCHSCAHFRPRAGVPYCALLERDLTPARLRIDCPEHARGEGGSDIAPP